MRNLVYIMNRNQELIIIILDSLDKREVRESRIIALTYYLSEEYNDINVEHSIKEFTIESEIISNTLKNMCDKNLIKLNKNYTFGGDLINKYRLTEYGKTRLSQTDNDVSDSIRNEIEQYSNYPITNLFEDLIRK